VYVCMSKTTVKKSKVFVEVIVNTNFHFPFFCPWTAHCTVVPSSNRGNDRWMERPVEPSRSVVERPILIGSTGRSLHRSISPKWTTVSGRCQCMSRASWELASNLSPHSSTFPLPPASYTLDDDPNETQFNLRRHFFVSSILLWISFIIFICFTFVWTLNFELWSCGSELRNFCVPCLFLISCWLSTSIVLLVWIGTMELENNTNPPVSKYFDLNWLDIWICGCYSPLENIPWMYDFLRKIICQGMEI